jgi:hypothetical protein
LQYICNIILYNIIIIGCGGGGSSSSSSSSSSNNSSFSGSIIIVIIRVTSADTSFVSPKAILLDGVYPLVLLWF